MSTASAPTAARRGMNDTVRTRLQQLLAFGALIVITVIFTFTGTNFLTSSNLVDTVLVSVVQIGILAVGTTFVIITGGIDLSIGFGIALTGVMGATFLITWDLPLGLGIVLTLLFGALVGFVNGFNISILGMPPFIATLAMMLVAQGLALVISDSTPIRTTALPAFGDLANGTWLWNIPNQVLVFALAAVVAWILLNRTLFGRYAFAIGSNEEATALSGVNVRKWKIIIYSVAGVFTALAGLMAAARSSTAFPAAGLGYELQAIAAVVIGGTSLAGGKGTIVGSVIGALIIGVLNNGLQLSDVPQEWRYVVLGAVILGAVYSDMLRNRPRAAAL